jgi:tripartite-type tricarboxylate transporter receptor subunit TctC
MRDFAASAGEAMDACAKANPGKLEYGHTGPTPHLAVEELSDQAGIQVNPTPFKGSAEFVQAILGGPKGWTRPS